MVTDENSEHGNTTVRDDTPTGRRGLDIIGAFLTATGLRAISRGIARVRGGDEGDRAEPVEAFCLRCRMKSPMQKAETSILTNGFISMQGYCSMCGTRMSRIMKRT